MNWMMKNSNSHADGVWTLTVIAFAIVSLNVLLNMFETVDIGKFHFKPRPADVTLLTTYFGLVGTGYVIRRNSKDKINGGNGNEHGNK